MVTTKRTNNQVNLLQVCSLNIEQGRLLQFAKKVLHFREEKENGIFYSEVSNFQKRNLKFLSSVLRRKREICKKVLLFREKKLKWILFSQVLRGERECWRIFFSPNVRILKNYFQHQHLGQDLCTHCISWVPVATPWVSHSYFFVCCGGASR